MKLLPGSLAALVLGLSFAAACSADDATGAAANDAGAPDAPDAPDAPYETEPSDAASSTADAAAPEAGSSCGVPSRGLSYSVFPANEPVSEAVIAYEGCATPTRPIAPDAGAFHRWALPIGSAPHHYRVTLAGHRTTLSFEIDPTALAPMVYLPVVGPVITPYDASKAHVMVSVDSTVETCPTAGSTVSLAGHPEAVVKYVDSAGNDVGAATAQVGIAWLSNVTPSADLATVVVTPASSACVVTHPSSTGQVALLADTVTVYASRLE